MLVYRIEDTYGKGMYRSNKSIDIDQDDARHPTPFDDSLLSDLVINIIGVYQNYIHGFKSIEQLRNWLYYDTWLVNLHEAGFVLKVYEVEEANVLIGHTQVVFLRSNNFTEHSIKGYFNV
jgi:hypothetical protein